MLSALSFGTNRDLTAQLQQVCASVRDVHIYRSLEHYPQEHETMRVLNSFAPQIVFVGLENESGAAMLVHDIRGILPSAAILGVFSSTSKYNSGTGLAECPTVALPCSPEYFRAATVDALNAVSAQSRAEIFAFLPAKAGSGATTAGLFVADILAKRGRRKVLLLECDLHTGPMSLLCNLPSHGSILDAVEDARSLNETKWKQLVSRIEDIDVLPSPGCIGSREATAWGYQSLLSFARSRYDVVIADLPEVVTDATEVVVRAAKTVFIVTTPSAPALFLAARRRYELESRGVGGAKVKFVMNRARSIPAHPRETAWALDAREIAAIPMDEALLDASVFQPALVNPATAAGFDRIAAYCSNEWPAPAPEAPRKTWLQGWLRPSRTFAHSTSAIR